LSKGWTPGMSEYGQLAYGFLAIDTVLYMSLCIIIENFIDVFREFTKKKEERDLTGAWTYDSSLQCLLQVIFFPDFVCRYGAGDLRRRGYRGAWSEEEIRCHREK
jgi:hypothetical protein